MTLTSQRKTEIIEERVTAMLKRIPDRAAAINEDGALPGDIMLPGPQRLDKYWAVTQDFSDVPLLLDPNWEQRIRQGLDQPPKNPYWLNLLRIPGLLKKTSADFVALNARYADRYQGGSNAVAQSPEQLPVAAGGGLPVPQAPAPGPPQPPAGGGLGGYGAP